MALTIRHDVHQRFRAVVERAMAKAIEPLPPPKRTPIRTDEELFEDTIEEAYL